MMIMYSKHKSIIVIIMHTHIWLLTVIWGVQFVVIQTPVWATSETYFKCNEDK